jgi:hypothetical protein
VSNAQILATMAAFRVIMPLQFSARHRFVIGLRAVRCLSLSLVDGNVGL